MADKLIFKWKLRFSAFRITYQFWIWPISSYLKEHPCSLRTPSTCRCSQWKQYNTVCRKTDMHVRLGIILEVFQVWPTNWYSNEKLRFSPFRITYQFWIWPISWYLKEPPCALRTPSTCRCSQWKQCNTVCRKTDMHVRLGIILEVFKCGRQIYIQMKA